MCTMIREIWYEAEHGVARGEAMVAARWIIAVSVDADQHRALVEISRSRTEPANRVERAGIILAYLDEPSRTAIRSSSWLLLDLVDEVLAEP